MGVRVIVCGSRGWRDKGQIVDRLAQLPTDATVVHGDARGADRLAADAAKRLGLAVEPHPADWRWHRKQAGVLRNAEMAEAGADLCIAFWDGQSPGTLDMIERAQAHGIPVEIRGTQPDWHVKFNG
jgi:hypothetical protein